MVAEVDNQPHAETLDQLLSLQQDVHAVEAHEKPLSQLPFRQVTQFVTNVLHSENCSAQLTTDVSTLYVDVLALASVSYDEVCLSASMHRMSNIVRTSLNKSRNPSSSNKFICTPTEQICLDQYVKFWRKVVKTLLDSKLLSEYVAITPILISSISSLVHHSTVEPLLRFAEDAMCELTTSSIVSPQVISAVYKALFRLMLMNLPAPNRKAVVNIMTSAVEAEYRLLDKPAVSPVLSSSHPIAVTNFSDGELRNGGTLEAEPSADISSENDVAQLAVIDALDNSMDTENVPPILPLRLMAVHFFKLCCLHVADKADERASLSTVICCVLQSIKEEHRLRFSDILCKCAMNTKVATRLVCLEIASRLLNESHNNICPQITNNLVSVVAARCQDSVASIRSKAISNLFSSIMDHNKHLSAPEVLEQVVKHGTEISTSLRNAKSTVRKAAVDFSALASQHILQHINDHSNPSEAERLSLWLVSQISYRCSDVVAAVRLTAAIHISQAILTMASTISLEKLKAEVVSSLEAVLPLLDDVDQRCRNAALHYVACVMCDTSEQPKQPFSLETKSTLRDIFLDVLGTDASTAKRLLERGMYVVAKDGKFSEDDVCALSKRIGGSESEPKCFENVSKGAWVALAAVARGGHLQSTHPAVSFQTLLAEVRSLSNPSACKLACHRIATFQDGERVSMETLLRTSILRIPPSEGKYDGNVIEAMTELLCQLSPDIGAELLASCDKIICQRAEMQDEEASWFLHVVGGICEHFQILEFPPENVLTFVQAKTSNDGTASRVRALAIVTLGKICLCEGNGAEQTGRKTPNQTASEALKIGESLTRRFISVFVHELDNATSSATRSNAVYVLCDLCRRYTSIVEPFITRIAGLMSDPSDFVRNLVLSSLMNLLQEDYIKMRPGFFLYQLANNAVDPSEAVRRTAEYSLTHVVNEKNKSLLAVSFVELILVLNECEESNTFSKFKAALTARRCYGTGEEGLGSRMIIYDIFLQGMAAEQKWRVPGRLRNDILRGFVELKLNIDVPSHQNVLRDALTLLSSDHLNPFTRKSVANQRNQDGNSDTRNGEADMTNKTVVLRALQLAELRDSTVPMLIQLRSIFQNKRSPLLGLVMQTLCGLLFHHRHDLSSFVSDATLLAEIEHEVSRGPFQQNNSLQSATSLQTT